MTPKRYWLPGEIVFLREKYPDSRTDALAAVLGRSVSVVYQKAAALGLVKSDAYRASPDACRLRRGGNVGEAHRFKPGQPSWSKGTKGLVGVQEGCRATQFKAGGMQGAAQHNYVPIGTLRLSKDGYLERKVTDDHPVPARRWTAVHRLVWEAANGPVPPGHVVVYRPGRKTVDLALITLDAIELVTRAELMARNSIHQLPPQLAEVVHLRGRLTRAINQRTESTP